MNFENFGGYIFCYESGFFRYKSGITVYIQWFPLAIFNDSKDMNYNFISFESDDTAIISVGFVFLLFL